MMREISRIESSGSHTRARRTFKYGPLALVIAPASDRMASMRALVSEDGAGSDVATLVLDGVWIIHVHLALFPRIPPRDSCHWGTRGGAEHRLILIALHQVDREVAFLPGFSSIYSGACCGGYCRCAHSHPAATRLQPLAVCCLSHVLPVQHVHGHCCLARETPPVGGDVIDLSSPSTWNRAPHERSSGSPDATAAAAWTRSYPPASSAHPWSPGSAYPQLGEWLKRQIAAYSSHLRPPG